MKRNNRNSSQSYEDQAALVKAMKNVILTWTFLCFFHPTKQNSSGQSITVGVGATVYLSCKSSEKVKQRWAFRRHPDSRKEFISTLFKNNTVKKERADPESRFTHTIEHLIISELQPQDSGLYLCNNRETAVLTVTTESTDTENSSPEINKYLIMVAVLALCVLAMVCVCFLSLMINWKTRSTVRQNCRKQTEPKEEGLELQMVSDEGRWISDALEDTEEVQYASLGVHQWTDTDRPQISKQHVIYSTLRTGTNTS